MNISYQTFDFLIKFKDSVFTDKYPAFVLRAVLGKNLKDFACILKGKKCDVCPLKFQCAYSFVFETPIEKNNSVLAGRDRATHPFILSCSEDFGVYVNSMNFRLSLFGRGIDYFPYICYTFLNGENNGLFRQRAPYSIQRITSDDTLVYDGKKDDLNIPELKDWSVSNSENVVDTEIKINFVTPVRMKIQGAFTSRITYRDIIFSAFEKAVVMTKMYGVYRQNNISEKMLSEKSEKSCLKWKDYKRYSSRQKTEMLFGGNLGSITVSGKFSDFELSILRSAEIFGLGKSTTFGFGQIKLEGI